MFGREMTPQGYEPTEIPSKERLTDEVVNNLLSFVGNSEIKIGLLLSMDPIATYSGNELYRLLPHAQMQNPVEGEGWKMNSTIPAFYCESSLIPAGMVEKKAQPSQRYRKRTIKSYRKTPEGQEIGDAFGGLMMHFSSRHPEVSLLQLLGGTNSSAKTVVEDERGKREVVKRSPAVRNAFYAALLDPKTVFPTRVIDVAGKMIERHNLISAHASRAGENNIISFASIKRGAPVSAYRLAAQTGESKLPAYFKEGYFPYTVYQTLSADSERWWTIKEITELLIKERPTPLLQGTSEKARFENMKVQAANTLSKLRDNGHVVIEKFDSSTFSTIELSPKQREILEEFLAYIDAFQNQNPDAIDFGRKFAEQLREDPQLLAQLILKGKEASVSAGKNAKTSQKTAQAISTLLLTHPDITTKSIRDILDTEHTIALSTKGVRIYLDTMRAKGDVFSYPNKTGLRWRLAKKPTEK